MNKPLIMGILNVTPDSFFDGGAHTNPVAHAAQLIKEGADIIDIGGESTRPGASVVSPADEAARIIPVLKQIRLMCPKITISIDTYKAATALASAQHGADIINDPSGLADPELAKIAAKHNRKLIIMHTRGTPQTMNTLTNYTDILAEITEFFKEKAALATNLGVPPENIIIDPGFGFAKTKEQNLFLLENISHFKALQYPLLIALSRKRFLSRKEGDTAADRLQATLEANAKATAQGADMLRVHDVAATTDYLK
ncbi:dihydropteroate synthase [Elusimicrobium simillimum]|uniref:dihydropteroate synthase n=1 Tax=Elusimicrobium simillimum TaxID=3143438 RepID=UPI003C6F6405